MTKYAWLSKCIICTLVCVGGGFILLPGTAVFTAATLTGTLSCPQNPPAPAFLCVAVLT